MSGRKVKKVSFYYPKNIQGINVPEGSAISQANKRNVRLARLSDAILGRKATVALGNSTVQIVGGASQVMGWIVRDPHMRERTQLRSLVPIKLLISARVHRLSFSHPSLDINTMLDNSAKKMAQKNKRKGKSINDSNYLASRSNMPSLLRAEQHRLSRDGIIEDHFRRKNIKKTRVKCDRNTPVVKGIRRLISKKYRSPSSLPAMNVETERYFQSKKIRNQTENYFDTDTGTRKGLLGNHKDDTENVLSYATPGLNFAAAVMNDPVMGQIGRYLPDISCRVPESAVCMELVNMSQPVKSTQPLLVEAPHILWGTARDPLFHEVANDGCPFVDRRDFEFFEDSEIYKVDRSESLMLITSTVWVDYLTQQEKMPSFGSVVQNNTADALERANILINNLSPKRKVSMADSDVNNEDVGSSDREVVSGSSISLQGNEIPHEQVNHDSLQRFTVQNYDAPSNALDINGLKGSSFSLNSALIENVRTTSKSSNESDIKSELSATAKSRSVSSEGVKKNGDMNQKISGSGEIDYMSEKSEEEPKISLQHSVSYHNKATMSTSPDTTIQRETSLSIGNLMKQESFSDKAVPQLNNSPMGSTKIISDLLESYCSPRLGGQTQESLYPPSLVISLKENATVASDVSSKHSVSSHTSEVAKSSYDENESIHFKSIASGTFLPVPNGISATQVEEVNTNINNGSFSKPDFEECYASATQSTANYSRSSLKELTEFQPNSKPPSIHAPLSPEINKIFDDDVFSVNSLQLIDAFGYRKEWAAIKSLNESEVRVPGHQTAENSNCNLLLSLPSPTESNVSHYDERNQCSPMPCPTKSNSSHNTATDGKSNACSPLPSPTESNKSLNIDLPYVLVLDEIIYFNVVQFPGGDVIASFPVSVASVLSERTAEDRDRLPGEPSELTLTFCQEPSMVDQVWGVEATVTFRCTIANSPRKRKFRFLNRKKDSRGNMDKGTSKKSFKQNATGRKIVGDHSSLELESHAEDNAKEVESESKYSSSSSGSNILLRNNIFYDSQVEPIAHELKKRRGQRSPTSNESCVFPWGVENAESFATEASQSSMFNSLFLNSRSSIMQPQKSEKVDQFDICATPHSASHHIESDVLPAAATATATPPARHEEEHHFHSEKNTAEKKNLLSTLFQSSKTYVLKNFSSCLSSVADEDDRISLIRNDLIKRGSVAGTVGEDSFRAALRANLTDNFRLSSFADDQMNVDSLRRTSKRSVSRNRSAGSTNGPGIVHNGDTYLPDGHFAYPETVHRSRWLQLNPVIRSWTWVPLFLNTIFNFYTFLLIGIVIAVFLMIALINYYNMID